MRTYLIAAMLTALFILSGCKGKKPQKTNSKDPISLSKNAPGDKTIYGLACDGCTDSVIVLLPNAGGDPITFNVIKAKKNKQFFGDPGIGDWLGIIVNPKNKHEAQLVIDLDEIKGTWTYQVMPKLKDVNKLSKRSIRMLIANMPDSIKETYMIPREYGFTLARQSVASPVGFIMSSNDEESPVEYPTPRWYTEWHAYNGKIILIQGEKIINGVKINKHIIRDTLSVAYLHNDSLALIKNGNIIGFHRQKDARSANAKAQAATNKQAAKDKQKLK